METKKISEKTILDNSLYYAIGAAFIGYGDKLVNSTMNGGKLESMIKIGTDITPQSLNPVASYYAAPLLLTFAVVGLYNSTKKNQYK